MQVENIRSSALFHFSELLWSCGEGLRWLRARYVMGRLRLSPTPDSQSAVILGEILTSEAQVRHLSGITEEDLPDFCWNSPKAVSLLRQDLRQDLMLSDSLHDVLVPRKARKEALIDDDVS